MKKKGNNKRWQKILFCICCILFALIFWFVVKYNQIDSPPIIMWGEII